MLPNYSPSKNWLYSIFRPIKLPLKSRNNCIPTFDSQTYVSKLWNLHSYRFCGGTTELSQLKSLCRAPACW